MKRNNDGAPMAVRIAGWAAAAAALAWAVVARMDRGAADSEGGEEPAEKPQAIEEFAPDLSRSPAEAKKTSAEKGNVEDPAKWSMHDKWNVPTLYELLGNVPPETRALADRIFYAHRHRHFDEALACVDGALACDNPVVRAMMADALRLFVYTAGRDGDAVLGKVADAARRFFSDPNAYVRRQFAAVWLEALGLVSDAADSAEGRVDQVLQALAASDRAVADYYASGKPTWQSLNVFRRASEKDKGVLGDKLSRFVESRPRTPEAEVAKEFYRQFVGEKYVSRAESLALRQWREDVEKTAAERYPDAETRKAFLALADKIVTGEAGERAAEIMDGSLAKCKNPWMCMNYAAVVEGLEREAVRRYGDSDEGREWLEHELALQERRFRKAANSTGDAIGEWEEEKPPRVTMSLDEIREKAAKGEPIQIDPETMKQLLKASKLK